MNEPSGCIATGMAIRSMGDPIGVYADWANDIATSTNAATTGRDWLSMILICFMLPAMLTQLIGISSLKLSRIKDGDLLLIEPGFQLTKNSKA